jgi:hypothetical protein
LSTGCHRHFRQASVYIAESARFDCAVGSMGRRIHIIQIWVYLVWHRHARVPRLVGFEGVDRGTGLHLA